jgi:hypothetical protein
MKTQILPTTKKLMFTIAWTGLLLSGLLLTGCGSSSSPVVPVTGQLKLEGGDAAPLTGHMIEVTKADDNLVRSYGEIKPDGNFELESLIEGKMLKGVQPGKYHARIVLGDDDPQQRQLARAAIHPRYLKFNSSGLSFDAPATGPVQLQVSRR